MPLRRLRGDHLDSLYAKLLDDGRVDGKGGGRDRLGMRHPGVNEARTGARGTLAAWPRQVLTDSPPMRNAKCVRRRIVCGLCVKTPSRHTPRDGWLK